MNGGCIATAILIVVAALAVSFWVSVVVGLAIHAGMDDERRGMK